MSNTKVTIEFSNGDTREFVASDELEKLIEAGDMFSVTTMHGNLGEEVAMMTSKMYAGNPMAALGNMIMMRHNAESLDDDDTEYKEVVIDVLTACIKLLSDEITSHQSGISPPLDKVDPTDCPAINDQCDHYAYQKDRNGEVAICICEHPDNPEQVEGNCTSFLCPLYTGGGG